MTYNYNGKDKDDLVMLKNGYKIKKKKVMICTNYETLAPDDHINLIIKFCRYHWNKPNISMFDPFSKKSSIGEWDNEFMKEIQNLDAKRPYLALIAFLKTAQRFGIEKLVTICKQKVLVFLKKN